MVGEYKDKEVDIEIDKENKMVSYPREGIWEIFIFLCIEIIGLYFHYQRLSLSLKIA